MFPYVSIYETGFIECVAICQFNCFCSSLSVMFSSCHALRIFFREGGVYVAVIYKYLDGVTIAVNVLLLFLFC